MAGGGHFINSLYEISTSLTFSIKALKTLIGIMFQCTPLDSTRHMQNVRIGGNKRCSEYQGFQNVFFTIVLGSKQKTPQKLKQLVLLLV